MHSARNFASYFKNKIEDIRSVAAVAPAPTIDTRSVPPLSLSEEVTPDEVARIVRSVPSKHCQLDAAPTWLIEELVNILSPVKTMSETAHNNPALMHR